MALPPADDTPVETEETDWPLRPHAQEQRQNVFNVFLTAKEPNSTLARNAVPITLPCDVDSVDLEVINGGPGNAAFGADSRLWRMTIEGLGIGDATPVACTGFGAGTMGRVTFEYPRPQLVQGMRLLVRLWLGWTNTLGDLNQPSTNNYIIRLTFYRNTK